MSQEEMQHKRLKLTVAGLTLILGGAFFVVYAQDNGLYSLTGPSLTGPSQANWNDSPVVDADRIKVGISSDAMTELEYPSATISATGGFRITAKDNPQLLHLGTANQNVRISRTASGFWIAPAGAATQGPYPSELLVETLEPNSRLKVTSVTRKGIVPQYRGVFEILKGYSAADKFTVVNVLPMQDYLKAVVPNELPYSYGYEAVKAQAVAARNYAIRPREKPWKHFDICDSQYCQAYYGSNTEHPQTTRALTETQGLVALYDGEPILALYSSSHGGYAENYENAFSDVKTNRFPGTPLPYLRGGPDRGTPRDLSQEEEVRKYYSAKDSQSYDVLSPNYRWQKSWSRPELEAIINRNLAEVSKDKLTSPFVKPAFPAGGSIGHLKGITVKQRGVSGKVMALDIEGTNGTWTLEKEFVIRKVLKKDNRFLPSANVFFDCLKDKPGNLVAVKVSGGGFGHGVGMSQLGASYLSRQGKTFVDILQHYYKNTAIGSMPVTATATQGMKTEFFADSTQGKLYVKTSEPGPVRVAVNDKPITLTEAHAAQNGRLSLDVQPYLKSGHLNELKIFPVETRVQPVKAWIELYEPAADRKDAG